MKQLIFAALLSTAFISKPGMQTGILKNSLPLIQKNDTATIEGRWVLLPVMASDTAAGIVPYISFNLKTKSFTGNTGCNKMSGNFVISQDALQFNENVISTRMVCPGYNEKAFLDNLISTNRYEIKNNVLQLMYNTTILSKWTRQLDSTVTKEI